MKTILTLALAIFSVAVAYPALAQDAGQGTGPLPSPNVASTPVPICTDRPTKANVACTTPAGDIQIETDLVNWTRLLVGGTQTDTILYTNPTVKLGVGTHTDLELNIAPYETVRTQGASGTDSEGGVGDLYLRIKQRLTADSAKTQVSVIPYVKAPTARTGVGNGQWEGGAIVAANIPIPAGFTLTVGPEVDILANADLSGGHHASLTMLGNLSHGIGKKLTVYGEFWTQQNFDPTGTMHEYSLDIAAAYLLSPTWQIDLGGNFGLNRATPATQVYLGLSTRF